MVEENENGGWRIEDGEKRVCAILYPPFSILVLLRITGG